MSERTKGAVQKTAPARKDSRLRSPEQRGVRSVGRIDKLFIGQSHGLIRLADMRQVFFHRSDVRDGTSFNALSAGDSVQFELLEDRVSGPRAVRVELRRRR